MKNTEIKNAFATYTGGGIWLFNGELKDGTFFLGDTDDYGATRILNADPSDFDESLYAEWQEEHLVKDLDDETERIAFCEDLIEWLRTAPSENRGGISDDELERYKNSIAQEF